MTSEENVRLLLENLRDYAIFTMDLVGRVDSWNPGAERTLGYSSEEILGKGGELIFTPEDREQDALRREQETALRDGRAEDERWHIRKDGSRFWGVGVLIPLWDQERRLRGFAKILRDLTESKLAQDAQARHAEELEGLAHIAAHDLREPLRTIASYAQLLEHRYRGKLDSDADDFLRFILEAAFRMNRLLDDLLAYARVGAGHRQPQEVDAGAVLEQTLRMLARAVEQSGAVVTHDPLPVVRADPVQLGQLLQNLISNAIQYGGDEPQRIHVSARQEGDEWVFSVRDQGIGIDPRFHDSIFALFRRLHTQQEHPGSGLGLAICKRIVEGHGGRIWVESQPGQGSTFYFTLPR